MGSKLSTPFIANDYLKEYTIAAIECGCGSIFYFFVFGLLFKRFIKNKKSPNDALQNATTTISTMNAVISLIGFGTLFIDKRWQNPVIDEPKLGGHVLAIKYSYFLADFICTLLCYLNYDAQQIPRRFDLIIHHLIVLFILPYMLVPKPIYYWFMMIGLLGAETSTLFLNLQWFAKHYGWSKKIRGYLKFCFLLSWYGARMPIFLFFGAYWMIKHWNEIYEKSPKYIAYGMTTMNCTLFTLQVIWSCILFTQVLKYCGRSKEGAIIHGMQLSLGTSKQGDTSAVQV